MSRLSRPCRRDTHPKGLCLVQHHNSRKVSAEPPRTASGRVPRSWFSDARRPVPPPGSAAPAARNDKAIILLWVGGGPSHLETYDLKPDAPSTTRSFFKPIRTRVPGLDVCELLPKHAAVADKFTLLRSVAHDEMDHGFGSRRF